jgi:hypothetical protein
MDNSLSLYRIIMDIIWQNGVRFHDLRILATFGWAVVGLILSQQIHLSQWSLYRVGTSKAASKERQLARWLDNPRIQPARIYRPLIRAALADWEGESLSLALDSSQLWERFTVVRLALIYRGRALPVSWVVLASQSATVALEDYQIILKEAARVLPTGCRVILLADRGFFDQKLLMLARDLGWSFRIRLKKSFWIYRVDKPRAKVGELMPAKGQALFLHKVWITARWFGPVHLALAHVQTPDGFEEWAILSDEPTSLKTLDEFGLRFDIEENFLDDKSAGFQLEASQIRDAQALSRLGLILATATLYLVSSGVAVVAMGKRYFVDPHWNRGLSYFQIGWRWIKHALAHGKCLLPFFWFDPGPDPEPVYASKRQALKPIAILSSLRSEVT